MKLVKSLPILLILTASLFQVGFAYADVVQITGRVYDTDGEPVEGVSVGVFSLTPPWIFYGGATTDAKGHYSLSAERAKRLKSPMNYIGRGGGGPVYEGYMVDVADGAKAGDDAEDDHQRHS